MKGEASYPFSISEAVVTFTLLMSIAYGSQLVTVDYFRGGLIDVHADRVERAAVAIEGYPGGSMDLDLEDYEFKVNNSELFIRHKSELFIFNDGSVESVGSANLSRLSYSSIDGPSNYRAFGSLCIEKTFGNTLVFREGC